MSLKPLTTVESSVDALALIVLVLFAFVMVPANLHESNGIEALRCVPRRCCVSTTLSMLFY